MLRITLLFFILSISFAGHAQQTIDVNDNLARNVTVRYSVLKNNHLVKQGIYQAIYKKNIPLAQGNFTNGKRTGLWHFYNAFGKVVQHYNYDDNTVGYVVDEDPTRNITQFEFIPKPADTARLTAPIKIGGLFFGYLPYLKFFKVQDVFRYNPGSIYGVLQMLITPAGRLAECKLLVYCETYYNAQPQLQVVDTYVLNTDLLDEYDKQFIPATVSYKNVSSTINVYCQIAYSGSISIVDNR